MKQKKVCMIVNPDCRCFEAGFCNVADAKFFESKAKCSKQNSVFISMGNREFRELQIRYMGAILERLNHNR